MPEKINAAIYRASELGDLVREIASMRDDGKSEAQYRAEMRAYNKKRRGRPEVELTVTHGPYGLFTTKRPGFVVEHMGKRLEFPRPAEPAAGAWARTESCQGLAYDIGLLANGGQHNRPVRPARVREYREAMLRGEWRDLLSDPIAITADGEVINGQHRLAAVGGIAFDDGDREAGKDPRFLVLFDVDPAEVLFADRSKRSGNDVSVIARKAMPKPSTAA